MNEYTQCFCGAYFIPNGDSLCIACKGDPKMEKQLVDYRAKRERDIKQVPWQ